MSSDLIHEAKILIIDDELADVQVLENLLKQAGYQNLAMTNDPGCAVAMFTDASPDLVLLDLHMPQHDGYELLRSLRSLVGADSFLPIIVLTGEASAEAKRRALTSGATDFLSKPLDHDEVMLRIDNAMRTRFLHLQLESNKRFLEQRVRDRTRLLELAVAELRMNHLSPYSAGN